MSVHECKICKKQATSKGVFYLIDQLIFYLCHKHDRELFLLGERRFNNKYNLTKKQRITNDKEERLW